MRARENIDLSGVRDELGGVVKLRGVEYLLRLGNLAFDIHANIPHLPNLAKRNGFILARFGRYQEVSGTGRRRSVGAKRSVGFGAPASARSVRRRYSAYRGLIDNMRTTGEKVLGRA